MCVYCAVAHLLAAVVPEDPSAEIDADVEALLQADFQIGHFIRERIVPHAVLYFTGDIDTVSNNLCLCPSGL